MPDMSLGQRLVDLRKQRRMPQQRLADAAGVSVDVIRKLEQGQRHTARLDSLVRLANALDVPIAMLLGKTAGLAGEGQADEIGKLRSSILASPDVEGDPLTVEALRAKVLDLWRLYWSGRYAELARELPADLGQARGRVRAEDTAGQRAAHAVVAELLQIAAALLAHLAYEDLAHVALLHATAEAEKADDGLLRSAQQATLAWVLARQGLWTEAERLSVTEAEAVEPTLSKADPNQLAVWGELLRYGLTAVARSGRRSEAEQMQTMVWSAAAAMGDRRPTLTSVVPFGNTIAGMSAVGIAVATDEPRRALALAARVEHIDRAPLSIQARYLLNVAYAQTMDWQSLAALETLRRVDALAPSVLAHQTIARAIVTELWPRRGQQRLPGLSAIADRVGLSME